MTGALSRRAAHRIAAAVVAAELRRLRDGDLPPSLASVWEDASPIGDEGLGLDSMEQLGALGALAETFDVDDKLLRDLPPERVGDWIDAIVRRHATGDGKICVATSGSTGAPMPCDHALVDLLGEAAFLATCFPDRRRIVAMIPAHHLYGIIWTALLPDALDVPVISRAAGASLELLPGDLVVAVPAQWQALARLTRRFPDDIVGVTSAGPIDDVLAGTLLATGLTRLVDMYGSSETSGIAMRDLPDTAFTLLPRWRLARGEDWTLVDAEAKTFALPDHVERIGERCLRPIGRRDGMVQVGGHNVSPARVTEVLRTVDGVAEAAVRLHANGRLKTFIVPAPGFDTAQVTAAIERVTAARLSPPEQPKNFCFGAALPRDAMGKLKDWS